MIIDWVEWMIKSIELMRINLGVKPISVLML